MYVTIETLETWLAIESIVLSFFLLLTCAGYPGWLKIALMRIKGKKYVMLLTRDNSLKFKGASEVEGTYKTNTGIYELEPEDAFTFNGTRAAIWYAPYNRSVEARIMPILRELKKAGIDTLAQLNYFLETPLDTIRETHGEQAAELAILLQNYPGKILQEVEVIRISDLKNYLESRSPAAENGIIERYVGIERRKLGNPLKSGNMVMMLLMAALLGLAFGYIIGHGGSGGTTSLGAIGPAVSSFQQIT